MLHLTATCQLCHKYKLGPSLTSVAIHFFILKSGGEGEAVRALLKDWRLCSGMLRSSSYAVTGVQPIVCLILYYIVLIVQEKNSNHELKHQNMNEGVPILVLQFYT